ncbi:hypothetical protein [Actinopolyspora alba]|uniref:hypothetical protein n=1 Tax=Actinopolyspora alba TaxID=673379 RepID=UPI000B826CAF|nr:hypothetical protein [Actinopolyspora alba]
MPDREREHVLTVKRGEITELRRVLDDIERVSARAERLLSERRTPLPAEPDHEAVSAWSIRAQRSHWGWM